MVDDRFRLVTRSDFDGLVCAVLLKELDLIDEVKFVHPKDVQDGLVDIKQGDIITNLPYSKSASYVLTIISANWRASEEKQQLFKSAGAVGRARRMGYLRRQRTV